MAEDPSMDSETRSVIFKNSQTNPIKVPIFKNHRWKYHLNPEVNNKTWSKEEQ